MEQSNELTNRSLPAGKWELIFGSLLLVICLLMINCFFFGGLYLGFAIAGILCILCSSAYLLSSGCKPGAYSITLLVLSLVISASFARSDDTLIKLVMVCFLFVSTNLSLCLTAGKNQHHPGSVSSLLDSFSSFFTLGIGEISSSCHGISNAFRRSGSLGQKGSAILLGLGISVPVLLIIVPLLIQADAAFEGMLRYLPRFSIQELFCTVLFGVSLALILYTRNTALRHKEILQVSKKSRKGMSPLTVNTFLITVCLVYCAYLVSQLAYFTGGFAGILPEDYTLAQYARRGFFEMAWLCAINLSIVILSLSLCVKEKIAPLFTRLLCLFIGIVTLFLVVTASAKMLLYIENFGLTRLRVLTQVVMIFLGIATALVCIWLFASKLPYMKAIVITALIMGAAVSWMDVNTQVARYNVSRYLDGNAETVDVYYLDSLGDGVIPYIAKLAREAPDPDIAEFAQAILNDRRVIAPKDFRDWNYASYIAAEILGDFSEASVDNTLHSDH